MSLDNLKNQSFPLKTIEDWQKKAEESLKGKSIESLKSNTYENIVLKPLYSNHDQKIAPDFPGGSDFRRGVFPLGYVQNSWKVAQRIAYHSVEELKEKLLDSVEKGQTALSFEVSDKHFKTKHILKELIEVLPASFPLAINGKELNSKILAALAEQAITADQFTGYVGSDPISLFAEGGFISEEFLTSWTVDIKKANENLPNLRTVLINTSTYHQGGANAVQELGIAAATGTFYLQQLLDSGMELEDSLERMIFQFSIGSNFFMELAKLRAARILWDKITKVYGAKSLYRGMHIAAETSSFTKTVYDPHVNLLRAGNEAFAAVVGGVQYLHVTPFDDLTDRSQLSERIARNTQNILKEEAHLQKVVDPAGGSWYVEALTTELAAKAWQYFQQIEANGGMIEILKTSWLQDEITSVNEKRKQDIFTRKQSIVGTNVYANLEECASAEKKSTADCYWEQTTTNIPIKAIPKTRLSEPFEYLRSISQEIERKSGVKPQVGMICLGELKQYKPRLDFMKGFLAAGGIQANESEAITSLEHVKQFIRNQNTKYLCLCGSNEQYETLGRRILAALKNEFPNRYFYLAGIPDKDKQKEWVNEGIKEFIHLKSNCYETLSSILTELEVSHDEVTKA